MSASRPRCQCDGSGWIYYTNSDDDYWKEGCEQCQFLSSLESQLRDMRATGNVAAILRLEKALDAAYQRKTP